MSFISTRGGACVTASQAILRGLAPDGGLYVPAVVPQMTLADIAALTKLDYRARALTILRGYLDDFNAQELADAIASAYEAAKFDCAHEKARQQYPCAGAFPRTDACVQGHGIAAAAAPDDALRQEER